MKLKHSTLNNSFNSRFSISISDKVTEAAWVSYDMVNPNDRFGRVMLENLRAAGHRVPGLLDFPTLEQQVLS
jgi:hypothetical protein